MKPMDLSDLNGPAIKNASRALEVKDSLMVVLKEYDALRKQVDQGTAFMQGLVIPLSVGLSGAMIGWQGKIPPELALLTLPVLIMCALAAAHHGEAYTEYTGQLLAAVEDRVFQLSGVSLLCHETILATKRKGRGGQDGWFAVVGAATAYALCEVWLYSILGAKAFLGVGQEMKRIAFSGAAVPVLYGIVTAARLQSSRSRWSPTGLAIHLYAQGQLPKQASKLFCRYALSRNAVR